MRGIFRIWFFFLVEVERIVFFGRKYEIEGFDIIYLFISSYFCKKDGFIDCRYFELSYELKVSFRVVFTYLVKLFFD